jgi:hypothetical protein
MVSPLHRLTALMPMIDRGLFTANRIDDIRLRKRKSAIKN